MKTRRCVLAVLSTVSISIIYLILFQVPDSFVYNACTRIPVQFLKDLEMVAIKVKINGYPYFMQLDLGSSQFCSLQKKHIAKVGNCKEIESKEFININGEVFREFSYLIPTIEMGNQKFSDVVLFAETEVDCTIFSRSEKIKNRRQIRKNKRIDGTVGLPLFLNFVSLFDFQKNRIILTQNISLLEKESGYFLDEFAQVPIEYNLKGIIVHADTDAGMQKLLLDTGTTRSILRPSVLKGELANEEEPGKKVFNTKHLVLNEFDFGNYSFVLYEFSDFFEDLDGFLGLDFFQAHVVCIDVPNRRAYIKK